MVLRLIGTARSFGFLSHISGHLLVQARNNVIDLSVIQHKPRKQIACRSYLVQSDSDINTVDLCTLSLKLSSFPADTLYTIIHKSPKSKVLTSYQTSGACLRCGGFNHWLANCLKPARPSS
jgi:hypothetical protein